MVHNGAYAAVIQFVENNGYRITGPFRESYIDGIWKKESEEEWLTEIQLPVEKISRRISLTNRLAPSKLKAENKRKGDGSGLSAVIPSLTGVGLERVNKINFIGKN